MPEIFVVRTGSPEALAETLRGLPMIHAIVIDDSWNPTERTCQVQVFGPTGFFVYAMEKQGYGEVLGEVREGT
jgi:hypothetical protein